MSISSVSTGTTASYTPNTQQKDLRTAFKQMADAINSGNLQDAQNAFDSLAQLMNNNQQSSQTASSSQTANGNDPTSLLNQIGSALQSGDLDQAKQALQNLQQQAQSSRGHHHHHHGSAVGKGQDQASGGTTSASTDGGIGGVNLSV